MSAQLTITGTAGPALTVAATVFTNVTFFTIDTNQNMIYITQGSIVLPGISVAAAATVTATKSGNAWTLVIS